MPKVKPSKRLEISLDDLDGPTARPVAPAPPATKSVGTPVMGMTPPDVVANQQAMMLAAQMNAKNPGVAIALSLLFPGAGQMYCGAIGRGVLFFLAYLVSWVLIIAVIGIFLVIGVLVWACIDASNLAKRHNAQVIAQTTGVVTGV